ncbi:MAG: DUF5018 domain-containing protein [Chloroflexi bacterium]|nr:DUF5018 domain-containing protein [Chloroflexota bacterium]
MSTNDSQQGVAGSMHIFNNLIYHNGYHDWSYRYGLYIYDTPDNSTNELNRVFRNNIAFDNAYGQVYNDGGAYTHSNNSWDGGATITSADFKALPASQNAGIAILSAPRKPDGSLPDLGDYFQLTSTSDAIDAGVDVGLPYVGAAPDLGPFEYDPGFQSSAKNIISFTLPQQTGPAIINTGNYTVSIEVAHGTNVSSLTPTISVSAGATINPASGVARNFNTSQTYVVTAEDASTQTWTVTVTVASEEPSEGKWVPVMKNGEFVIRNNRIVVKYIEDGN